MTAEIPKISPEAKGRCIIRLVDDDPSVLRALRAFLTMDDWQVECYESGKDFLASSLEAPGCLVLDMRMPGMTGIEVQEEMIRRGERLPIIFLSAHGDIELAVDAVKRGARTFLVKPPKPGKLLSEIESACSADIERRKIEAYGESLERLWNTLTAAEQEVARLVAKGLPNSTIGSILNISERTVRSHKAEIYGKLDVANAVETADFIRDMEASAEKRP
ncbi:response regulator [Mesosutterella sp. AGMB02718]|uniref:Response regulator n=1 Tax=Mesosutterella faecium TaxID=2925194 RepID=A0ABT7IPG8_9BURK|nr:response regulator [Mesosutterella sp. AGMB02718]MDL2059865.1 response regulator [Mesosutterella sp. AGMB02718]